MQVRTALLVGALGLLLALVGGSPAASADSPAAGASQEAATARATMNVSQAVAKVRVTMKEWSLKLSTSKVQAGKVTFIVRNAGTMEHEFVVLRTNKAPRALPMRGGQASETGMKGEIEEFKPGLSKRLTLTLQPGKYVLLCNLPGHYKKGQFIGLLVTPTTSAPSPAQTTQVSVSAFEMAFKLSQTKVPHGTVIFTVKNDGKVAHDFSFGSRGGGTPLLQPGESAKLTVTFTKPGKYTFICTVPGHLEAGMTGVLTVV